MKSHIRAMWSIVMSGFLFVSGITTDYVFGLSALTFSEKDSIWNSSVQDIHTVLLHVKGNDFSTPVILLNSDQKLELSFDDLSAGVRSFDYTLVHCGASWKPSDLQPQEFVSGYGSGSIRESASSFNTTYDYRHFRLEFPEEDCMPVISGNFVIVVYEQGEPDKIILTRRFFVTEETAKVTASVRQPPAGMERKTSQQVQFTVSYNAGEIRDPVKEVTAVVLQNNRFDRQVVLQKPWSFQPGRLEYNGPDMGIMPGGNEFRSLDIKNVRYQTQNMAAIDFRNPYYHVLLKTDEDRSRKPWFSNRDLNGSFYIDAEKADDRHVQADYVYVHFSLNMPLAYADDKYYVTGAFADWRHDKSNQLMPGTDGFYSATLLMKQGLYDYCYMKNTDGRAGEEEIEGSFYETENMYSVFIYFHDQFKRYDRLIGYTSTK